MICNPYCSTSVVSNDFIVPVTTSLNFKNSPGTADPALQHGVPLGFSFNFIVKHLDYRTAVQQPAVDPLVCVQRTAALFRAHSIPDVNKGKVIWTLENQVEARRNGLVLQGRRTPAPVVPAIRKREIEII